MEVVFLILIINITSANFVVCLFWDMLVSDNISWWCRAHRFEGCIIILKYIVICKNHVFVYMHIWLYIYRLRHSPVYLFYLNKRIYNNYTLVHSTCLFSTSVLQQGRLSATLGFTDLRLYYYIEIYSNLPKSCIC